MKNLIIIKLLFFSIFLSVDIYGQEITGPITICTEGENNEPIYLPFDPSLSVNGGEVGGEINVTSWGGVGWFQNEQDALMEAVSLWNYYLGTNADINIAVEWVYTLPLNARAGTTFAKTMNFGFGCIPDMLYPLALVNHMKVSNQNGNNPEILIQFNASMRDNGTFSFGLGENCPTGKVDFKTVAFHEIAHGLGFASSAQSNYIGEDHDSDGIYNAYIYDLYVDDAFGTNITTYGTGPSSATPFLANMFTSNNLTWNSNVSNSPSDNAKLYAPTTFAQGSSVSHLDAATYSAIGVDGDNRLMTPGIGLNQVVLTPGPIAIDMLSQIGWGNVFSGPVGLYDMLFAECPFEVDIDETFNVGFTFEDTEEPSSMSSTYWKLEIVLKYGGTYLLEEGTYFGAYESNTNISISESDLPEGLSYYRTALGQLKLKYTVWGTDSDGFEKEAKRGILVNYKPETPKVYYTPSNNTNCYSGLVNWHASGADYYTLMYQEVGHPNHHVLVFPDGDTSYMVENLDQSKDYEFWVYANNEYGSVVSERILRESCRLPFDISVYPNPSVNTINIDTKTDDNMDSGGIDYIDITRLDNPGVGTHVTGDGVSTDLNIDISNLPNGTYNVSVIDSEGNIDNQILIKY